MKIPNKKGDSQVKKMRARVGAFASPRHYHNYLLSRDYIKESESRSDLQLQPVGIIHSPFKISQGTPLQPRMAESIRGTVEIFPPYKAGLKDLLGFERIWLIYWFHRAGPSRLLVAPYMDSKKRGLFATRAPCRPNPIGISTVRLLSVRGCILHVSDLDVLDGTPLLDIKPYVPKFDAYRVQRWGWLAKQAKDKAMADSRFERK